MNITNDSVAYIDYVLTNNEGTVIDSTENHEPLAFLVGRGQILPALEHALLNKKVGDVVKATLTPEEGYGPVYEERKQYVAKEEFAHIPNLHEGMQLHVSTEEGGVIYVNVTKITDEKVLLDANHPLAGVTLNFNVTVANVRAASDSEINTGELDDHKKESGCGGCSCGSGGCC